MLIRNTYSEQKGLEIITGWQPKQQNFKAWHKLPEQKKSVRLNRKAFDDHFLFDYNFFPGGMLRSTKEWELYGRSMMEGDMIIQWVKIPPFSPLHFYLIFAVRVVEVIRSERTHSFTYHTLHGHPERGRASFQLEKEHSSCLFTIHSFSAPSGLLNAPPLSGGVLAYQRYSVRKILTRMSRKYPVVA